MANGTGAATAAGATATKGAAKKGFAAWYAGHKPETYIGAAGIVVALALYVKSKNTAAGTSTSSTTPSSSTVMPGTLAPDTGSYGMGGGDITGIESLLSQLNTNVSALKAPAASSPAPSTSSPGPAPGPTFQGSGYTQGQADIPGQGNYYAIQPGQVFAGNTETYFEEEPGLFEPIPGSGVNLAPGTTQYVLNTGKGLQQG